MTRKRSLLFALDGKQRRVRVSVGDFVEMKKLHRFRRFFGLVKDIDFRNGGPFSITVSYGHGRMPVEWSIQGFRGRLIRRLPVGEVLKIANDLRSKGA